MGGDMPEPKYVEIANRLRDRIESGALPPGQRLPSEPELADAYQASRNTVRLAIAALTNQGLIVTRQGLGTYVQAPARPFTALLSRVPEPQPRPSAEHHVTNAMPVVSPEPEVPSMVRLLVETVPASPSVAEKLDVPPGEPVVVRRSEQAIADVPWQLINSFFPADVARGTPLEQARDLGLGTVDLLADLGHAQIGFVDEIGARMPTAREFGFFSLTSGTPVIVVNRTAYSADRPIRLTRYIYRSDRVRLAHEEGTIPVKYRTD
jgi:GntR family transcriptional regulator